jgi:hypothetical protein
MKLHLGAVIRFAHAAGFGTWGKWPNAGVATNDPSVCFGSDPELRATPRYVAFPPETDLPSCPGDVGFGPMVLIKASIGGFGC